MASVSEAHTAIHADNLRTSAFSTECVGQQDEIINQFSTETFLKLNSEKLEIVKKLRRLDSQESNSTLPVRNRDVSTSQSAKCLGMWWNSRVTAIRFQFMKT